MIPSPVDQRRQLAAPLLPPNSDSPEGLDKNLSALFRVIVLNDLVRVKKLLERHPYLVNAQDVRQIAPIHFAASCNRVQVIGLLIKRSADIDSLAAGQTSALKITLQRNFIPLASLFLQCGADITFIFREAVYNEKSPLIRRMEQAILTFQARLLRQNKGPAEVTYARGQISAARALQMIENISSPGVEGA